MFYSFRCGRGEYSTVSSILTSQQLDEQQWSKMNFVVFDVIEPLLFSKRWQILVANQHLFPPFVSLIATMKCKNFVHLKSYFQSIKDQGGEGIIIRDGCALYTPGRSGALAKLKSTLETEVRVLAEHGANKLLCEQ